MLCPKCGANMPDDAAFCGQCGARFDDAASDETRPLHSADETPTAPQDYRMGPGSTQPYGEPVATGHRPESHNEPGFTAPFAPVAAAPVEAPKPKRTRKLAIALVILVAVVVIAVAAVLLGRGGVGGPAVRPSLAEYSWTELSEVSELISKAGDGTEALRIARQYNLVGSGGRLDGSQAKPIELADGTKTAAILVGIRHDIRSDGEYAGLTFMFADAVDRHPMAATPNNAGGWRDSAMRTWLNGDFLRELPSDLRQAIVMTSKQTNNEGGQAQGLAAVTTTDDAVWLFSISELCGDVSWRTSGISNLVLSSEGEQYQLFGEANVDANGANECLVRTLDGKAVRWWTRSPRVEYYDDFNYVSDNGGPHYGSDASDVYGVVPGFCL